MDRQRLFKAYLELVILFRRFNSGEVVFRLRDGSRAVISFKVERAKLYLCPREKQPKDDESA